MAEYEEAGYYEIQLNNKQLVFFFMSAVAIAVVVFLCGVMVGRGVRDATLAAGGTNVLSGSETGSTGTSGVAPDEVRRELDFPQRLEADTVDARLSDAGQSKAVTGTSSSPEELVAAAKRRSTSQKQAAAEPKPGPTTGASTRSGSSTSLQGSSEGALTIQVVALKTEKDAQSLVKRLERKGYRAYVESGGSSGLYRVRVGRFDSRGEAEVVAARLRTTEKFKPYITQ